MKLKKMIKLFKRYNMNTNISSQYRSVNDTRNISIRKRNMIPAIIYHKAIIDKKYNVCYSLISKHLKYDLGAIVIAIQYNQVKMFKMLCRGMCLGIFSKYFETLFVLSVTENSHNIMRLLMKSEEGKTRRNTKKDPYKTLILPKRRIKVCLYNSLHLYEVEKITGNMYDLANSIGSKFLNKNLCKLSSYFTYII